MDYSGIKFLHVTRLDEVPGILAACYERYVFPKLDGTNGTVWADEDGTVHAGSRNRELSVEDDNAGFCKHVLTSDAMEPIRRFCVEHPSFVVCGEWLGGKAGHIKQYLKREFWVFDVHYKQDEDMKVGNDGYKSYKVYSEWLRDYPYVVPPMEVFGKGMDVTVEDIAELAEKNSFNLPCGVIGEGVVVKAYLYTDSWGRYQEGKLVRDEFRADKGRKKVPPEACAGKVEEAIADDLVTASDVEKCKNKVADLMGQEFSLKDGKMIGGVIEMAFTDLLQEEIMVIYKKYGKYPINLKDLKGCVTKKVKGYLGL